MVAVMRAIAISPISAIAAISAVLVVGGTAACSKTDIAGATPAPSGAAVATELPRISVDDVDRGLAAGTLVRWADAGGPEIALWALYPSRRLLSARVSAFLAFLTEAFPKGTPDELAAFIR